MKAYYCKGRAGHSSTIILDTYGSFENTVEEFKRLYGLNRLKSVNSNEYMRELTNSRLRLFRDKTRLHLKSNPMTDDLAIVLTEWIARQPGFRALTEEESKALRARNALPVEEFEFRY